MNLAQKSTSPGWESNRFPEPASRLWPTKGSLFTDCSLEQNPDRRVRGEAVKVEDCLWNLQDVGAPTALRRWFAMCTFA